MRPTLLTVAWLTSAVFLAAAPEPPRPLAIEQFKQVDAMIVVHSQAFGAGQAIPPKYADDGEKVSPDLSWTGVPTSTKSLVVLVEDPQAQEPKPFVHWLLYNLPPSFSALPEAVPGTPRLREFGGALQGRSSRGFTGYFGPHPPKGDPAHHNHFEVFAVDTMLNLEPNSAPEEILAALRGRVIGRGELVGMYATR